MKILRMFGYAVLAIVVLLAGVALGARFADGPIGFFPGGPLESGPLVTDAEVDWQAVTGGLVIGEMQLLEPPRSRTLGFLVWEGALYMPCFFPEFSAWKQWPREAEKDGRAIVRIGGTRYTRQVVRVTDPEEFTPVWAQMQLRMGAPEPELIWIYRLDPRAE